MPRVRVRDLELSYVVAGQGPPLLLLPGTAENKEYWHEYQVTFFQRHYRVVTIDPREAVESGGLARDAIDRLGSVGGNEPAHVLGHSMGGRTAQWMALDYPDRVRSLTLVSSGSGQYDPAKPVERGLPIWQMTKMVEMGFE